MPRKTHRTPTTEVIELLRDGRPRWAPQIAKAIGESRHTVDAVLRWINTRGIAAIRVVPKLGYTICKSAPEIDLAVRDLSQRIDELTLWRDSLRRLYNAADANPTPAHASTQRRTR